MTGDGHSMYSLLKQWLFEGQHVHKVIPRPLMRTHCGMKGPTRVLPNTHLVTSPKVLIQYHRSIPPLLT